MWIGGSRRLVSEFGRIVRQTDPEAAPIFRQVKFSLNSWRGEDVNISNKIH